MNTSLDDLTEPKVNAIKLPFSFNAEKIKEELAQFTRTEYKDNYNPFVTLKTLWYKDFIVPIGGPDDPVKFVPNEALMSCPYILGIFNMFQCQTETFRVHTLDPGASISPHRDSGSSLEHGRVRIHIPVETNDKVEILLENEPVKMKEGECWYCNFSIIHEVHNRSDKARVHLILDCLVNDWLEEVFDKTSG